MRHILALILVALACRGAAAQGRADPYAMFVSVPAFCSAMANARRHELASAVEQINTIKREMARSTDSDFLTRINTYLREAAE